MFLEGPFELPPVDLAVVLGILGLIVPTVLAIYFYVKSQRTKAPAWALVTNNLVSEGVSALPGLEIKFRDKPIKTLSVTRLLFFNAGADPIRRSDLVHTDMLRIEVRSPELAILEAHVVQVNHPPNGCRVDQRPTSARHLRLEFEYLNQGQGCVIEVLHTGTRSADLELCGSIVGATKLRHFTQPSQTNPLFLELARRTVDVLPERPVWVRPVVGTAVVMGVPVGLLIWGLILLTPPIVHPTIRLSGVEVTWRLLPLFLAVAYLFLSMKRVPTGAIPDGLTLSEDEARLKPQQAHPKQ